MGLSCQAWRLSFLFTCPENILTMTRTKKELMVRGTVGPIERESPAGSFKCFCHKGQPSLLVVFYASPWPRQWPSLALLLSCMFGIILHKLLRIVLLSPFLFIYIHCTLYREHADILILEYHMLWFPSYCLHFLLPFTLLSVLFVIFRLKKFHMCITCIFLCSLVDNVDGFFNLPTVGSGVDVDVDLLPSW